MRCSRLCAARLSSQTDQLLHTHTSPLGLRHEHRDTQFDALVCHAKLLAIELSCLSAHRSATQTHTFYPVFEHTAQPLCWAATRCLLLIIHTSMGHWNMMNTSTVVVMLSSGKW